MGYRRLLGNGGWTFCWRLPVRVDVVADLLQQAEGSTQRWPKHVHRHQAAVPRRHRRFHHYLLDVGDRRTPVLQCAHKHTHTRTRSLPAPCKLKLLPSGKWAAALCPSFIIHVPLHLCLVPSMRFRLSQRGQRCDILGLRFQVTISCRWGRLRLKRAEDILYICERFLSFSYPVGPFSEVSLRLMGRDAVVSHPCGVLHRTRPREGQPQ